MELYTIIGSSVIASILVQLLKRFVNDYITPRWGALGVQILLLLVSFAVAGIGAGLNLLPAEILKTTTLVFVSALSIYSVVYKSVYQGVIKDNK